MHKLWSKQLTLVEPYAKVTGIKQAKIKPFYTKPSYFTICTEQDLGAFIKIKHAHFSHYNKIEQRC